MRSEEHRSLLESIGVTKRDVEDDAQDEAEFDEELYLSQQESDFLSDNPADYANLVARDSLEDEDFEGEFEGELEQRDVDQEEFDLSDKSLEGLVDGPIYARGIDDEDLEDDDDVDADADAAYDGAEVVEELVAPVLG